MRTFLIILLLACATLIASQNLSTSNDGFCSGTKGTTCLGSRWGNCCSSNGFCGQNATYCGAGCQTSFGACYTNAATISIDGGCGNNGKICIGSIFGNCCSSTGFCGSSDLYCGSGCNGAFGACGNAASSVSVTTVLAATSVSSRTSSATGGTSTTASTSSSTSSSAAAQSETPTTRIPFIAGVTVGAIVLVAILAGLGWYFLIRRRRSPKDKGPSTVYHEMEGAAGGTTTGTWSSTSEVKGKPISELPTSDVHKSGVVDTRAAAGYEGAYRGH